MALDASEMEDKARIKKILIVAPNWIGDAVLSVPAIRRVRECLPSAHIALLGPPHISELFKECPYVDEVKVYANIRQKTKGKGQGVDNNGSEACNAGGFLTTVRDIRGCGFDMAILFPNSFRSAMMASLAGIPLRCSYNRDGRGVLLNLPVRFKREVKRYHQVKYYLHLVKSLESYFGEGLSLDSPVPSRCLFISKDEANQAWEILNRNNITPHDLIIGINPGATYGSAKRWYPERFGYVARILKKKYNAKVIVFGGQKEMDIAEKIAKTAGVPLLNMAGKTSIRELMAMISHCRLLITNDSGPMHIAAALDIPVVAIFGSTDPEITGPVGSGHVVIKKEVSCSPCLLRKCPTDLRCMDLISVDDVLWGVEKILIRGPAKTEDSPK